MAWLRVLGSYLVFACAWPLLWRHKKVQTRRRERRGLHPQGAFGDRRVPCVWLHGASAGDILALAPTVLALRDARPTARLVVSALTDSGCEVASHKLASLAHVTALPWDVPHMVHRALDAIRPDVLVLEYAELWPSLLSAAKRRGVAVVLHNGRLTPQLMRRYRWLFLGVTNLLEPMKLLLMRDEEEAARAKALGAPPERVVVAGNTKVDHTQRGPKAEVVTRLHEQVRVPAGVPIWVAGSTHVGEEEHVLAAQKRLIAQSHNQASAPLLVVAPRYVERASEVQSMARTMGLHAVLYGALDGQPLAPGTVVVLDAVGLLFAAYTLARVVFVGGSFVPRGGQNMLEPASLGVPVCYGPFVHNFAEAVRWLAGEGGTTLQSPDELPSVIGERLFDPSVARREGERAKAAVFRHRGVAARNAAHIAALWQTRASGASA